MRLVYNQSRGEFYLEFASGQEQVSAEVDGLGSGVFGSKEEAVLSLAAAGYGLGQAADVCGLRCFRVSGPDGMEPA